MLNNTNSYAIKKFFQLKEMYFRNIGRAGDMIWIGFGNDIEYKTWKGEYRIVPQYSFHIQTNFRILYNGISLLSNSDMYKPIDTRISLSDFKWDVYGNNKYDKKALEFSEKFNKNLIVENIIINDLPNLKIELSNTFVFEITVNKSSNEEMWRFLKIGNNEAHIVATGKKIFLE